MGCSSSSSVAVNETELPNEYAKFKGIFKGALFLYRAHNPAKNTSKWLTVRVEKFDSTGIMTIFLLSRRQKVLISMRAESEEWKALAPMNMLNGQQRGRGHPLTPQQEAITYQYLLTSRLPKNSTINEDDSVASELDLLSNGDDDEDEEGETRIDEAQAVDEKDEKLTPKSSDKMTPKSSGRSQPSALGGGPASSPQPQRKTLDLKIESFDKAVIKPKLPAPLTIQIHPQTAPVTL